MAGSGCSLVEVGLVVDGSFAVEEGGQEGGAKNTIKWRVFSSVITTYGVTDDCGRLFNDLKLMMQNCE